MILGTFTPGTPEWHEARRWRVGGSEIGTVCGWSPHDTRDALLARKLSGEHVPITAAMERGTFLEAGVALLAAHRAGVELVGESSTYVHDNGWALYNPDDLLSDGRLLEVKTTTDRTTDRGWGRARTGDVPAHYEAQVQWGLGILGLTECLLAVLHGATNGRPDLDVALYRIKASPAAFAWLLGRGERFHTDLINAKEAQ